jgi:hypothetical protein
MNHDQRVTAGLCLLCAVGVVGCIFAAYLASEPCTPQTRQLCLGGAMLVAGCGECR